MAWQCKRWRTLPLAGGLEDQPLVEMQEMELALNTYDAFRAWIDYGSTKGWFAKNISIIKFVDQVNQFRDTGQWPE